MKIVIINNGVIEQVGELSELFPNVSHPLGTPTAEWMTEVGAQYVNMFKAHDARTEQLVPCAPYLEGGEAFGMQVEAKSAEQIEYEMYVKSTQIRAERNRLLTETDWRFRVDMNPSQAWRDYCQALRDITAQPGFPESVTWPRNPDQPEGSML